ncbi:MAG: hypothetical protein H6710_08900 [Myxococcales bacterium]|nr:hypothetical protein [Myxococcales bacterium]
MAAAAGVLFSAFLTVVKFKSSYHCDFAHLSACSDTCSRVLTSDYSTLFGAPLSIYSAAYFLVVLGLALALLWRPTLFAAVARPPLLVFAALGLAIVGVLATYAFAVVGGLCNYCMIIYGLTLTAAIGVSLMQTSGYRASFRAFFTGRTLKSTTFQMAVLTLMAATSVQMLVYRRNARSAAADPRCVWSSAISHRRRSRRPRRALPARASTSSSTSPAATAPASSPTSTPTSPTTPARSSSGSTTSPAPASACPRGPSTSTASRRTRTPAWPRRRPSAPSASRRARAWRWSAGSSPSRRSLTSPSPTTASSPTPPRPRASPISPPTSRPRTPGTRPSSSASTGRRPPSSTRSSSTPNRDPRAGLRDPDHVHHALQGRPPLPRHYRIRGDKERSVEAMLSEAERALTSSTDPEAR